MLLLEKNTGGLNEHLQVLSNKPVNHSDFNSRKPTFILTASIFALIEKLIANPFAYLKTSVIRRSLHICDIHLLS